MDMLHQIESMHKRIGCNSQYVITLFDDLPRDALVKIQSVLDSQNKPLKNNTVANTIFKSELSNLKKHEELVNLMKERLKLMSNLILTREFSNECGEVQWHVIKSHIEIIKIKRDKHQGRLEALAEQKIAHTSYQGRYDPAYQGRYDPHTKVGITPHTKVASIPGMTQSSIPGMTRHTKVGMTRHTKVGMTLIPR